MCQLRKGLTLDLTDSPIESTTEVESSWAKNRHLYDDQEMVVYYIL